MAEFTCPSCGKHVPGSDALAGKNVLCPNCDNTITLPALSAIATPQHAPQARVSMAREPSSAFREGEPPYPEPLPPIHKEIPGIVSRMMRIFIVVAIVLILLLLLFPLVDRTHEAKARVQSISHLKQIGLAFHHYHDSLKAMPFNGTGPAESNQPGTGSWAFQILPYMNQSPFFANPELLKEPNAGIAVLMCTGRGRTLGSTAGAWTDYALNTWLNDPIAGAFDAANAHRKMADITDGTSNTIFVGHATVDQPYVTHVTAQSGLIVEGGTSGTARNIGMNQSDKTASLKPGQLSWGGPFAQGSLMAMGDGTVRMFNYQEYADLKPFLTPAGKEEVRLPD